MSNNKMKIWLTLETKMIQFQKHFLSFKNYCETALDMTESIKDDIYKLQKCNEFIQKKKKSISLKTENIN